MHVCPFYSRLFHLVQGRIKEYFDRIQRLVDSNKLPSRIKFMLQDLCALRKVSLVLRLPHGVLQCINEMWIQTNSKRAHLRAASLAVVTVCIEDHLQKRSLGIFPSAEQLGAEARGQQPKDNRSNPP